AQQMQNEQAFRQAQVQHLGAEESRAAQLFPGQLQEQQMGLQQRQGLLDLANDPSHVQQILSSMTEGLGQTSSDEAAMLRSAAGEFQAGLRAGKFDTKPVNDAVTKIIQDRMTAKRGLAETTDFKSWHQQFIAENGREPNTKEIRQFRNEGVGLRITGME